jgi:hypothetical protein
MGRNSVTVDSKILIHPDKLAPLAKALSCDPDEELEASVTDALLYLYMEPVGRDDADRLQFVVQDGDYDTDYDVTPFLSMAAHLQDGSFYAQHDDGGLTVYEVQDGVLSESVYEPAWNDDSDKPARGELLSKRELESIPEVPKAVPSMQSLADLLFGNPAEDTADPWDTIRHWWKLDDPDWVAQRKSEWKGVEENMKQSGCVGPFLKASKHFFLTGEDIDRSGEFPLFCRFDMAPYESAEQARELFELYDENSRDRMMLLSGHLRTICINYAGSEKVRKKVADFQLGVLGETFRPIPVIFPGQKQAEPRPVEKTVHTWCNDALRWVNKKDQEFRVDYGYFLDQIPYLISMLHYLDADGPAPKKLIELKEYLDATSDEKMSKFRKEFRSQMLDALNSNDVPAFIQREMTTD